MLFFAEPASQVTENVAVLAGIAWRIHGFANVYDSAFRSTTQPLFLLLQAARHHDIRKLCGLGEEEIDDAEELDIFQSVACEVGVRQRDQGVEAEGKQAFDFATMDGLHDLYGRESLL